MIEQEFDDRTLANMTVALERACAKLTPEQDNYQTRKKVAESILAAARAGKLTLTELTAAGDAALSNLR